MNYVMMSLPAAIRSRAESRRVRFDSDRIIERIGDRDHSVWSDNPVEIARRLGCVTVADEALGQADSIVDFASALRSEGFRRGSAHWASRSELIRHALHSRSVQRVRGHAIRRT
jgi:hypothetical protein